MASYKSRPHRNGDDFVFLFQLFAFYCHDPRETSNKKKVEQSGWKIIREEWDAIDLDILVISSLYTVAEKDAAAGKCFKRQFSIL